MSDDPVGMVFDVQRGAIHDGPGIRTTVFLKGCPLRCLWCHNPESQAFAPETGRSGKVYGRLQRVSEIMDVVRRDRRYYDASGGGLTLSGGEPTAQYEFCTALLRAAHAEQIHTCLDTCGAIDWLRLNELRPLVGLFLFDYKATDDARHRRWTGTGNQPILENLHRLLQGGSAVRLRCPMIPGLNDTPDHEAAIDALGRVYPRLSIDRMPYHAWGESKYDDLGRPRPQLQAASMQP